MLVDIFRSYGPLLYGTIVSLIVLYLASLHVLQKLAAREKIPKVAVRIVSNGRHIVAIIAVCAVGYQIHSTMVNAEPPQSVSGRQAIDEQSEPSRW